jgi:hypothetical protein
MNPGDIIVLVIGAMTYLFGFGAMWRAIDMHVVDADESPLALGGALFWPIVAIVWGGARFARKLGNL